MTGFKFPPAGSWWAIVAAVAGGLLLGAALRYGILHNSAQELLCREGGASLWCPVRATLGWSIHYQLFGLAGVVLGAVAWVPGLRWLALPALVVACCGLLLYNTTYAAVAVIVALLAALHSAERHH